MTTPDEYDTDGRPSGWYVTIANVRPPVIETVKHPTSIVERIGDEDMEYDTAAPKLVAVTAFSDLVDPLEAVQQVCEYMRKGYLPHLPPAGVIQAISSEAPPWFEDDEV